MNQTLYWFLLVTTMAVIFWLLCKAVFQTYYREKERFWDRVISKLKGAKDGKK